MKQNIDFGAEKTSTDRAAAAEQAFAAQTAAAEARPGSEAGPPGPIWEAEADRDVAAADSDRSAGRWVSGQAAAVESPPAAGGDVRVASPSRGRGRGKGPPSSDASGEAGPPARRGGRLTRRRRLDLRLGSPAAEWTDSDALGRMGRGMGRRGRCSRPLLRTPQARAGGRQ